MDTSVISEVNSSTDQIKEDLIELVLAECGVCQKSMPSNEWIPHIQKMHSYEAWKKDEPAIVSQC